MTTNEDRSKLPPGAVALIDAVYTDDPKETHAALWAFADQQRAIGAAQERDYRQKSLHHMGGTGQLVRRQHRTGLHDDGRDILAERDARVRREALLEAASYLDDILAHWELVDTDIPKLLRELAEGGGK